MTVVNFNARISTAILANELPPWFTAARPRTGGGAAASAAAPGGTPAPPPMAKPPSVAGGLLAICWGGGGGGRMPRPCMVSFSDDSEETAPLHQGMQNNYSIGQAEPTNRSCWGCRILKFRVLQQLVPLTMTKISAISETNKWYFWLRFKCRFCSEFQIPTAVKRFLTVLACRGLRTCPSFSSDQQCRVYPFPAFPQLTRSDSQSLPWVKINKHNIKTLFSMIPIRMELQVNEHAKYKRHWIRLPLPEAIVSHGCFQTSQFVHKPGMSRETYQTLEHELRCQRTSWLFSNLGIQVYRS